MNQYITNNKPNENLIYVLDYLGISIDEFLEMSDEKIISIYKRSADALNDGEITKSQQSNRGLQHSGRHGGLADIGGNIKEGTDTERGHNDSGSKSRYFDIDVWAEKHGILQFPKASKRERNKGCEGLEEKHPSEITGRKVGSIGAKNGQFAGMTETPRHNIHPTVKPISVMAWLVRLVSKEGDTVLDPFMGSGTTGVACRELNRNFIGIELNAEYHKIAESRISGDVSTGTLPEKKPVEADRQLELFPL